MSEVNHSPTPWATKTGVHGIICDSNRMIIVDTAGCSYNDLEKVNASYIVSCVNSHDALTAENARLEAENAKMREVLTRIAGGESANNAYEEVAWNMVQWAKAALAAEGGAK